MTEQRRLLWFMVLSLVSWLAIQFFMEKLGLIPRDPPREPEVVAEAPSEELNLTEDQLANISAFAGEPDGPNAFAKDDAVVADKEAVAARAAAVPAFKIWPADQLVLGAIDPKADPQTAYHLQLELTQSGAGVKRLSLARHEAELPAARKAAERLSLINAGQDRFPDAALPPLGLEIVLPKKANQPEREVINLGDLDWEIVADERGEPVRVLAADTQKQLLEGRQVVFQTRLPELGLTIVKTIGLRPGRDVADLSLHFEAERPLQFAYRLQGPYGVPVEGEWYTSVFRDVFFGKINGSATELETRPANEVLEREAQGDPIRITTLPLKFAGIENQYFAVLLEPNPLPATADERWDEKTVATVIKPDTQKHKSEISVVIDSRTFDISPKEPLEHGYLLYAGPKSSDALAAVGATDLATYRKGWQLPLIGPAATFLSRVAIAPLLDHIYGFTKTIAGFFGGTRGNYGIAIILLTVAVRLLMFPLSRKQAQSAKRMQDLQPQLLALREQYKDDKEQIGRETLKLYQQNGVNPLGGCLLVFIQMPIFLGLWQALNNSVALRHSGFLWIRNLAAPDQLFPFGSEIPFLGPYFNLLPFAVIALMLVQTKLFSPPATTPEQKQQQSMMRWMMVVMMMMFYKVPSGLGLYFITSSLWSIGERLLLPKITHNKPKKQLDEDFGGEVQAPSQGKNALLKAKSPATGPASDKPPGWRERLRERIDQVIEDAAHDKTTRNAGTERNREETVSRRSRRPRPGGRR